MTEKCRVFFIGKVSYWYWPKFFSSIPSWTAPVAIPPENLPKTSPISQPIKHGSVPPEVDKRNESKSHNLEPVSPGMWLKWVKSHVGP
jgi:hypothetical protein